MLVLVTEVFSPSGSSGVSQHQFNKLFNVQPDTLPEVPAKLKPLKGPAKNSRLKPP